MKRFWLWVRSLVGAHYTEIPSEPTPTAGEQVYRLNKPYPNVNTAPLQQWLDDMQEKHHG